ncbi:MAG: hypothetical protein ACK4GN_13685 [Runella sp.]
MKNYLIITLGTREVQINKTKLAEYGWENIVNERRSTVKIQKGDLEIEVTENQSFENYLIVRPRPVGKTIFEHLDDFLPIIELPLIQPLLTKLLKENVQMTDFLLIYTDQESEYMEGKIKEFNYNQDTLYFKDIISEILQKHPLLQNARPDEYGIFEQVVNIDYQYDHFAESHKELLLGSPEQVKNIYLLPQGGIDQINHAITLQLLQAFKDKVKLYQQPEKAKVAELHFPQKFLRDLNKQKIFKHLEDYEFKLITEDLVNSTFPNHKTILALAKYARMKLFLQHSQLEEFKEKLSSYAYITLNKDNNTKLTDLYLSARIDYHQHNYNDLLWRLFTLAENLLRVECETILGDTSSYFKYGREDNTKWINFLNQKNPNIVPALRKKNLSLNGPHRKAFLNMYPILFPNDSKKELVQRIGQKLEHLAEKRHEIAHKLSCTDLNQIDNILKNKDPQYQLSHLIKDLDKYFGLSTPFGIYDQIKEDIRKLL